MFAHTPVLLEEVLATLQIRTGGCYLDATFGRGGHTAAFLERVGRDGRVVAIDRDPEAVRAGRERFAGDARLTLVHRAFSQLAQVSEELSLVGGFDGVLMDLGVSSPQLDDATRGFSFAHDGPLDMRMDNRVGMTAKDWLAKTHEHEIARVIREFGEERFANRIAQKIVHARHDRPLTTTAQLAEVVASAVPTREPGKHPATRTFQAIRIRINNELEEIEAALDGTLTALAPGGRICAISFHSLEDAIVKGFIQKQSKEDPVYAGLPVVPEHARPKLRRIGRAVHATPAEIAANVRSRSAIMRAAQRLPA